MKKTVGIKGAASQVAKTPKSKASDLNVIISFNSSIHHGVALIQDKAGRFFVAPVDHSPGGVSTPQMDKAKAVTYSEALKWYAQNEEKSHEGSGDLRELVAAILPLVERQEMREQKSEQLANAVVSARQQQKKEADKAGVTMTVDVAASSYGLLAEASVIHNCSIAEALGSFINDGDMLTDWANDGCPL